MSGNDTLTTPSVFAAPAESLTLRAWYVLSQEKAVPLFELVMSAGLGLSCFGGASPAVRQEERLILWMHDKANEVQKGMM